MDMKCGVFLNIAIVLEMKGNTEDSARYILKVSRIGIGIVSF
jgi:hypothetical protein